MPRGQVLVRMTSRSVYVMDIMFSDYIDCPEIFCDLIIALFGSSTKQKKNLQHGSSTDDVQRNECILATVLIHSILCLFHQMTTKHRPNCCNRDSTYMTIHPHNQSWRVPTAHPALTTPENTFFYHTPCKAYSWTSDTP